MEKSGQLYAPVVLIPGEKSSVSILGDWVKARGGLIMLIDEVF
jgi:hypothetical protein